MSSRDKKFYRKLKKSIKQDGNKRRRHWLKRQLAENPEDAPYENDYEFGNLSSKFLNGLDQDQTRRNTPPLQKIQDPWAESEYWHNIDER